VLSYRYLSPLLPEYTSQQGDHLLAAGVVPVAPYNARNTDDPKDIEYRVEDRLEEHSEDVQLKQLTLDKTYNRRTGVERTNEYHGVRRVL